MSELTYLEKLLDGVKVEWQTLGKVLKRTKGTKITAGQMKALHKDNAPLKIFAGGKTVAFVDFKDIPEKDINREPSIIVKSRGIIEFEYYDKPFSHKNEMWSYHSNNDAISIKYIYYFLKINEGYFQKIGVKCKCHKLQLLIQISLKFQSPARIIRKNPLPSSLKSFGFWTNSAPLQQSLACVKNNTTTIATSC